MYRTSAVLIIDAGRWDVGLEVGLRKGRGGAVRCGGEWSQETRHVTYGVTFGDPIPARHRTETERGPLVAEEGLAPPNCGL